ncbi:pyridoxamine 5'-phosphate oxidase family protein [Aquihabitans daechungensis]|uniref:pyridoxamine 5'-phosphate oxidase family protein n=1 Tax=Aquihabitans daechungensis TaxID=1052257 RepID=UPI003B9F9408
MTLEPEIERLLREGRQAHVAVVSPRGPHVTPELYAWSGGRLWFWFAHTTLKAKVLAASPRVAALVTVGSRSAVIDGEVDLIDVRRPGTLLGSPGRGLRAACAVGTYVARNAEDLGAFARDLGTGRLGWRPPPSRVLASLEPRGGALVEDGRLVGTGAVARLRPGRGADGPRPGGEPVVVALPGPRVAPGRWFAEEAELWVDPVLLDLAEVSGPVPVAVVADEYVAPGPAAKVGTLLRGTAERQGRGGSLAVVADTLTSWDGIETETHRAADAPGR